MEYSHIWNEDRAKKWFGNTKQKLGAKIAIFCVCVLLAGMFSSCAQDKPDSKPKRQVILILLDAARIDRFGSAGYKRETTPNMDMLGAGGAVFFHR